MSLFNEKTENVARIINQWKADLSRWNEQYRRGLPCEVSDTEFDRKMQELKTMEGQYPELATPDSPTQRIGVEPPSGWPRRKHKSPMLSLENMFSLETLEERMYKIGKKLFPSNPNFVLWTVEYKVDGCAVELVYEHGRLASALTRGDGNYGDDILENARTVPDIPVTLSGRFAKLPRFEVRGELYMKNSEFHAWNQSNKKKSANPRNATAGAIRLLDPKECSRRPLRFIAHSVACPETVPKDILNQQMFNSCLQRQGFATAALLMPEYRDQGLTVSETIEFCRAVYAEGSELLTRPDYEIDGLVIKLYYFIERKCIGSTSSSPRWAFALKMEKYEGETTLKNVFWQVGKTGACTPVAEYDPVQIAGTTVTYSTLSNIDIITELDLRIGDTVKVAKAGKIIPQIIGVVRRGENAQAILPPKVCPACGQSLVLENVSESNKESGEKKKEKRTVVRCVNSDCGGILKKQLEFYASREAVDIPGLGEQLVELLVHQTGLEDIGDLYALSPATLVRLPRVGEKSARKILDAIQSRKNPPLKNFIRGLPILHVGEGTSKRLSKHFKSLDAIVGATYESLLAVEDIGETTARSIYQFFKSERWNQLMTKFKKHGVAPASETQPIASSQKLSGKTIVVTGKLELYTRSGIEAAIEQHGGRASGSVSKNTDYLIVGAKPGSKLSKANSLGVPVLSEEQFRSMIGA